MVVSGHGYCHTCNGLCTQMINYFQLLIESEPDETAVPLVNAGCPIDGQLKGFYSSARACVALVKKK